MEALREQGNTDSRVEGGWSDTSGDGHKESLLDVRNEAVFDPVMVGEKQEKTSCDFTQPDPLAAYSFDEGTGTTLGDSAGAHNGTIEGASWSAEGKYGSALSFDGNDRVSIPDSNDLDLTAKFTLEAWVRPAGGGSGGVILQKGEKSSSCTAGPARSSASTTTRAGSRTSAAASTRSCRHRARSHSWLRGADLLLPRLRRVVRHTGLADDGRLRDRLDASRRRALRGARHAVPRRPARRLRPRRPATDRRDRQFVRRHPGARALDAR